VTVLLCCGVWTAARGSSAFAVISNNVQQGRLAQVCDFPDCVAMPWQTALSMYLAKE